MKKIGLLGGSFDPIHLGHLHLAAEVQKREGLDEVWFLPIPSNPFKPLGAIASFSDRLAMVECALRGKPFFLAKKPLSESPYMIDQVRALQAHVHYPHQFYLILGEDAANRFSEWRSPELLAELAPLLVANRDLSISSREIRNRLGKKLSCDDYLPREVSFYIQTHSLYG